PSSAGALEGITQNAVRRIAEDLGYDYVRGNILRSDLYTADEAFLSGTAAEVVPIRSVDDREIGDPGPITRAVQEVFYEAVRGRRPEYAEWNEYVD
ncbi:MAG: aminotransferase class IV, partial [Acidimicrobiales bacterium]|nr:aminotransferase class IV [Acidimicrobiales bacterium]